MISIAFSEKYGRIACLLSDNTVSLWDFPNLDYQLNLNIPI